MHWKSAALSVLLASLVSADTLTLRSGRVVEGSYLGGNSRQVRMAVEDRIETFAVGEVESIRFEGGPSAAAQPAAGVRTEAARPAARTDEAETAAARTPMRREPAMTTAPASTASAQSTTTSASGDVPAGTNVVVRMIDDVDSQYAQVGQTFRASVDEPVVVNGHTLIPRGADVLTKLVELKDPNKLTGGGQLTLDLASVTVNGRPVEVSSQAVTQAGESRKGETAKVVGGTAALGAIIGAIAGGGKGAAIGAISGAGAGTAIQVLTQGTRVRVPSETRLTFSLQQPLDLP